MAVELKWYIFDPMLVKPKCVKEEVVYLKIVNKQLKILNLFTKIEKNSASQTHFGLTNILSDMHRFSSTAIYTW